MMTHGRTTANWANPNPMLKCIGLSFWGRGGRGGRACISVSLFAPLPPCVLPVELIDSWDIYGIGNGQWAMTEPHGVSPILLFVGYLFASEIHTCRVGSSCASVEFSVLSFSLLLYPAYHAILYHTTPHHTTHIHHSPHRTLFLQCAFAQKQGRKEGKNKWPPPMPMPQPPIEHAWCTERDRNVRFIIIIFWDRSWCD